MPAPTERQARILWFALTALAVTLVLVLVGVLLWGLAWMLNQLTSVLLPLAVAAVLACLLDPVVDLFEARLKIPRVRAIILVFVLAVGLVLILLATVIPKLIYETNELVTNLPQTAQHLRQRVKVLIEETPSANYFIRLWDDKLGNDFQSLISKVWPLASTWLLSQAGRVVGWFGLAAGLALVPVYTFYFLLEREGIRKNWADYLPLRESSTKAEIVYVLGAFQEHLVAFFRGQVLVSLCSATLLGTGYLLMGLNYAVLLGAVAAVLGIIPYLGSIISVVLGVVLATVQFQDWLHPALVVTMFVLVQMVEGLYYSPKIIGDRIGLHPLTIIISVMVGTTLFGGIMGGVLAIPVTAALKAVMFRYVWKKRAAAGSAL